MNFGGPALHMGVVPSLAMLSGGQHSIGACTKPGNAPLTGQRSTEELRQARQCPSGIPALDRGVVPSLAMPLLCASETQRGHAKPDDAPVACQRLTGGWCQARRCLSGGPALDTGLRQAR